MNDNLLRIERLSMILMDEPWRVLQNSFPPTVLNHVGKALNANAMRLEGLGDEEYEEYARQEFVMAWNALQATEKQ